MNTLPDIMVAPNGAKLLKKDHPAVPLTVAELVKTARACFREGAGGLHAHVRDGEGVHVLDAGLYRELLAEMAMAEPGMLVQITTEAQGRYSPAEQRALVRDVQPKLVSVALREMLSEGTGPEVARFYHAAADAGISVQHILYDEGDVERLRAFAKNGGLPDAPIQVLLVLGRYTEAQVATPADLREPLRALREAGLDEDWAVCAFGPNETDCLVAAFTAGGKLRVGFENNTVNKDGSRARDNAERVREVSQACSAALGNG